RQPRARGADDVIEDDEGAESLPRLRTDVEEAVDHRQAVALLVGQAGADELSGSPIDRWLAIFDDVSADGRLLYHVGEIALVHLGHSAAGMPDGEVATEEAILLVGRPRLARIDLEVGVAAEEFALCGARFELGREHANRDAGGAVDAAWSVGDGLAAAEADAPERFVQFAGMTAGEFGENLPLDLAREIRARARVRHEELGKPKRCAHPAPHSNGYAVVYATGKRR